MQKGLFWIILILVIFGLIVLSSAGIVEGQKKFGSPYYYLNHQVLFGVLPGLALMFLFSKINYRIWRKLAVFILMGALVLMVLVFFPQFGLGLKGANRWLVFNGISFQPSEILKLAVVIYLAAWFGGRDSQVKNWVYSTTPFFVILGFISVLLIKQPDIGTLSVLMLIAGSVYFFAGARLKHIISIGLIGLIIFAGAIFSSNYRWERVKTFLDPSYDPKGVSYQVNQSVIAIGAGGITGTGFGKSTQKFGFLPEVVNDSIFAVLVEELGFVGGVVLIGLFIVLALTMTMIADGISDKFGYLFIMGMASWVTGQALINIGAISGLLPLTGIPLPFVSYGGTAMMTLLAGMGIVFNIVKSKRN